MKIYKFPKPVACNFFSDNNKPYTIYFTSKFRPGALHAFDEIVDTTGIELFVKDPKIDRYVREVCEELRLQDFASQLMIMGANIPSFAEYRKIEDDEVICYLLYNPLLLDSLMSVSSGPNGKFAIYGILFHEFGHLAKQHGNNRQEKSNIMMELEADLYAGQCMHDMNADSGQCLEMLAFIRKPEGTDNYPSKEQRRLKLLEGWRTQEKMRLDLIKHQNDIEFRKIDSIRKNFFEKKDYARTIDLLKEIVRPVVDSIPDSNNLIVCRLLGESYYGLAQVKPKKYYPMASNYFDIYLSRHKDPDLYIRNGEAYYYIEEYALADTNCLHALDYKLEGTKEACIYYYLGASALERKNYTRALYCFNKSLEKDLSNPNTFEKRGDVRNVNQKDSLILILDDYYSALSIVADSNVSKRLRAKIRNGSATAYENAMAFRQSNPKVSIRLLQYLKRRSTENLYPDVNFEIANCYQVLFDTLRQPRFLDSIIRYQTYYLDVKPDNSKAMLMRGRTYYTKYKISQKDDQIVLASIDLKKIAENTSEYSEASYYKILCDIKRSEYCEILQRYDRIKKDVWRNLIKPEICRIIDELKKQECIDRKSLKPMKKVCKKEL
jgi:tetratricopeptide (TPR) repeat protein